MTLARAKPAQQERSRRTRDKLLAAGHKLLARKSWGELAVTSIAKAAGCSVGSFYARYGSKEEFFEALCADFLDGRIRELDHFWDELPTDADLAQALVANVVGSVTDHRNLWQAALTRATTEPEFWAPFRETGMDIFRKAVEHQEGRLGRPLSDQERQRLRFAQLLLNSYINNTVMVRPGPFSFDEEGVINELTRAVRLVAEL